ncbi:2267_t:CDS:2, partial [Gigaspora margarita]
GVDCEIHSNSQKEIKIENNKIAWKSKVKECENDDKIVTKIKSTSCSMNRIEKADKFKTYYSSSQGTASRDNNRAIEDIKYVDHDQSIVKEDAK